MGEVEADQVHRVKSHASKLVRLGMKPYGAEHLKDDQTGCLCLVRERSSLHVSLDHSRGSPGSQQKKFSVVCWRPVLSLVLPIAQIAQSTRRGRR